MGAMSLVNVTSDLSAVALCAEVDGAGACWALTPSGATRPVTPIPSNATPATRPRPNAGCQCFRTAISHTPWIPNYTGCDRSAVAFGAGEPPVALAKAGSLRKP